VQQCVGPGGRGFVRFVSSFPSRCPRPRRFRSWVSARRCGLACLHASPRRAGHRPVTPWRTRRAFRLSADRKAAGIAQAPSRRAGPRWL